MSAWKGLPAMAARTTGQRQGEPRRVLWKQPKFCWKAPQKGYPLFSAGAMADSSQSPKQEEQLWTYLNFEHTWTYMNIHEHTSTYMNLITKGSVSYLSSPCFSTSLGGIGGPAHGIHGILAVMYWISIIRGGGPPPKMVMGSIPTGDAVTGPHIRGTLSMREMSL